jgi:hypothetical protein
MALPSLDSYLSNDHSPTGSSQHTFPDTHCAEDTYLPDERSVSLSPLPRPSPRSLCCPHQLIPPNCPAENFYSLDPIHRHFCFMTRLHPPDHHHFPNQLFILSPLVKEGSPPLDIFLAAAFTCWAPEEFGPRHGLLPGLPPYPLATNYVLVPPPTPLPPICYFCDTSLDRCLFPIPYSTFPVPPHNAALPYENNLLHPGLVSLAQAMLNPCHPFHFHSRLAFWNSGVKLCNMCNTDVRRIQRVFRQHFIRLTNRRRRNILPALLGLPTRAPMGPLLPRHMSLISTQLLLKRLRRLYPAPLAALFPSHHLASLSFYILPFLSVFPYPHVPPTPDTPRHIRRARLREPDFFFS